MLYTRQFPYRSIRSVDIKMNRALYENVTESPRLSESKPVEFSYKVRLWPSKPTAFNCKYVLIQPQSPFPPPQKIMHPYRYPSNQNTESPNTS